MALCPQHKVADIYQQLPSKMLLNYRKLLSFRSKGVSFILLCIAFTANMHVSASEKEALKEKQTLKIAQLVWCPEICPGEAKPGYIVELLREVFKESQYTLSYTTFPWSRALASTKNGASLAVIAPAKKEAPELLYPKQPVGYQRACFYTLSSANWTYNGQNSLKGLRIGLPSDMSLEEVHDYVISNRDQFYFQAITSRYLPLSINMLLSQRLDAFGFTENAVIHQLKLLNQYESTIRQAGCVNATPVFLAFTPTDNFGALRDDAMTYFDRRLLELRLSGKVSEILASYDVPDWDTYFTQ